MAIQARVQGVIEKKKRTLIGSGKSGLILDTEHWASRAEIAAETIKATAFTRKVSVQKFAQGHKFATKESIEEFEKTEEAQMIEGKENTEVFLRRICERQLERGRTPEQELAIRRS